MSRFDYVRYDNVSEKRQAEMKHFFETIESGLGPMVDGRSKSLALTKLEEAYMWVGKSIRDDQIARNGSAPLMEQRKDG